MARRRGVSYYRSDACRFRGLFAAGAAVAVGLGVLDLALLHALATPSRVSAASLTGPVSAPERTPAAGARPTRRTVVQGSAATPAPRAGLWTFRGGLRRAFYGVGPVPRRSPRIVWRYPRSGNMCARSRDETGVQTWCGVGWTGQANVVPRGRRLEVRFGAFDRAHHFLDAQSGRPVRPSLLTGDLAKGSATSDPDGFPLYYAGSRDNKLRVVALDRGKPTVLWALDSYTGGPITWNDDWDGAALVVDDHLLVGGENSWFYVVRLHRRYDRRGKVQVRPRVVARVPSWDGRLLAARSDRAFSIESSVSYHRGIAYFANSAGLVQGWDVRRTLAHGKQPRRVFRFWTGDDTDASVAIDERGFLYVASELERFAERSRRVGQLLKLDPRRPRDPVVWSVPLRDIGRAGKAGSWSTPAIDRRTVYVATNAGGVVAVDRRTGRMRWTVPLDGPTWGSPVVVDGVLLEGDCRGVLHAFDVRDEGRRPPRLWSIRLGGCIESTPSVWRGRIYIGTRGGAMYAIAGATR